MWWWPTTNLVKNGEGQHWAQKKLRFGKFFFDQLAKHNAETGDESEGPIHNSYWVLILLRLLIIFIPQGGCIHPDEFFQTLEPVAGKILDVEWKQSWEFNSSFPIRNLALPFLSIGLPLKILQTIDGYVHENTNDSWISAYSIIVIPRLFYFILSLICDYCLYKISNLYGERNNMKLIIFASSYVTLVYLTRTFSNTVEVVLLSVLLYIVCDCMITSNYIEQHKKMISDKYENAMEITQKVKYYKIGRMIPNNTLSQCVQIATITMFGIFNRPTFIAYAFPSIFIWMLRGLGTEYTGFKEFHARLFVFVCSCIPSLLFLVVFDSFYYGYLSMSDIGMNEVDINNFVVTPLNFLKYNLLSENLAEHGLHPRWLHILVNIPLLFNVLGLVAIFSAFVFIYRFFVGGFGPLPRVQSLTGLMTLTIIFPVMLLSIFPHQEPRFLIPLQLPVILLCTNKIDVKPLDRKLIRRFKAILFAIGICHNIIFTLFYGFIHQGGIYPVVNHMSREILNKPKFENIHIVTSHTYNLPQSLLLNKDPLRVRYDPKTKQKYKLSKQTFLYELGSQRMSDVVKLIKLLWITYNDKQTDPKKIFRLYLIIPDSLRSKLNAEWDVTNVTAASLKLDASYYPHLSTEALPYFPDNHDASCISDYIQPKTDYNDVRLTVYGQMYCFLRQFSLNVYRIEKINSN